MAVRIVRTSRGQIFLFGYAVVERRERKHEVHDWLRDGYNDDVGNVRHAGVRKRIDREIQCIDGRDGESGVETEDQRRIRHTFRNGKSRGCGVRYP